MKRLLCGDYIMALLMSLFHAVARLARNIYGAHISQPNPQHSAPSEGFALPPGTETNARNIPTAERRLNPNPTARCSPHRKLRRANERWCEEPSDTICFNHVAHVLFDTHAEPTEDLVLRPSADRGTWPRICSMWMLSKLVV